MSPCDGNRTIPAGAGRIISLNVAIALRARGIKVDNVITMGTPYREGFPNRRIPKDLRVTNFVGKYDPLSSRLSGPHITNITVNNGDSDFHTVHTGYRNNPVVRSVTRDLIR